MYKRQTIHQGLIGLNTLRDLKLSLDVGRKLTFVAQKYTFPLLDQGESVDWELGKGPPSQLDRSAYDAWKRRGGDGARTGKAHGSNSPRSSSIPSRKAADRLSDEAKPTMKSRRKFRFWAVAAGWTPGIYRDQIPYRQAFETYPKAIHKGFRTRREAEEFMTRHNVSHQHWIPLSLSLIHI